MGWGSGSRVFSEVIEVVQAHVADDDVRQSLYVGLIDVFEEADCDTLDECQGVDPAFDAAFNIVHPMEDEE